jgi:Dolichyl-phosphate-mannose-protein mannosyltransferase
MRNGRGGQVAIVLTLILATGVFYLATIRAGHIWGDDFAMYIHHAKNLAYGNAYADTGYIYNPHYPDIGPRAYPPLFPLLLAPVYRIMGLDLGAMKALNILVFLVFLFFIYLLFRPDLPFSYVLAILAVLAFNPFIWILKDQVISDFLFLLLMVLTFHAVSKYSERPSVRASFAVAVCIALSFACRTIGFLFLPCVLLYDLIRFRKLVFATVRTVGLTLAFMAPQMIGFSGNGSHSSYTDQLQRITLSAALNNVRMYLWLNYRELWWNGYSPFPALLICSTLGILGLYGYVQRLRSRLTVVEIFVPAYAILIVILWSRDQDSRLLIPLVPFWLFYVALGLREIGKYRGRTLERAMASVLLLLVFGSFAGAYSRTEYGPFAQGLGDSRFTDLSEYIKTATAKESVFLFAKPRLLALVTGRRASGYQDPLKQDELWDYCSEIGVNYIISSDTFDRDRHILEPFVAAHRDRIEEIYHNTEFHLYKVSPASGPAFHAFKTETP